MGIVKILAGAAALLYKAFMIAHSHHSLLPSRHMRQAEHAAIAQGITAQGMMEAAGRAVADLVRSRYAPRPTLVACGPGNNGGDGFVAARALMEHGWPVAVALTHPDRAPAGAAAAAQTAWTAAGGNSMPFSAELLGQAALCVDAIFGTGLSRPVSGLARTAIEAIASSALPVIAVDIASGVGADNGEILGAAAPAAATVTFFRAKPGHYLLPGKRFTGELYAADIGIGNAALADIPPSCFANAPALWRAQMPSAALDGHKYRRGHALIIGGPTACTGAAKLAAISALRAGAGLASIACPAEALTVYAAALSSVMVRPIAGYHDVRRLLADERLTAVLCGPGNGLGEETKNHALEATGSQKPCVLDADALSVFADAPKRLLSTLHGQCVLTPHEGEFERLFDIKGSKIERARQAAGQTGAVVLLKGNDTVIASPDGTTVINHNAPPWLATAGSGDVLAGVVAGLLAQGMPPFEAACAGAWLQGEAAGYHHVGMISEDLPASLPRALHKLHRMPRAG